MHVFLLQSAESMPSLCLLWLLWPICHRHVCGLSIHSNTYTRYTFQCSHTDGFYLVVLCTYRYIQACKKKVSYKGGRENEARWQIRRHTDILFLHNMPLTMYASTLHTRTYVKIILFYSTSTYCSCICFAPFVT